jgi:uncharacterized membrane protein YeiB
MKILIAIVLPALGAVIAAFAVWLAVRIVNRRERWAIWTAVVLVNVIGLIGSGYAVVSTWMFPYAFGPGRYRQASLIAFAVFGSAAFVLFVVYVWRTRPR